MVQKSYTAVEDASNERAALMSGSRVGEADKSPVLLIPQRKTRCAKAAPQAEASHRPQRLDRLVAGAEPVVRHPGIEVMDVVEADVAGQPMQHLGQAEGDDPSGCFDKVSRRD